MDQLQNQRDQLDLAVGIVAAAAQKHDMQLTLDAVTRLIDDALELARLVIELADYNTPENRNQRELDAIANVMAAHKRHFGDP